MNLEDDEITLRVLKDHATVKAVKDLTGCETFYALFEQFVDAFTLAGTADNYMENKSGPVAQAYDVFQAENEVVQKRMEEVVDEQKRRMGEAKNRGREGV